MIQAHAGGGHHGDQYLTAMGRFNNEKRVNAGEGEVGSGRVEGG